MSGGWFCPKHNVQWHNQNYCELCKIDEAEQIKMTREEAEFKVSEIGGHNLDAVKWIKLFEALGLLKFDETKKRGTPELYKCGITESNLEALEKAGYEIIKVA